MAVNFSSDSSHLLNNLKTDLNNELIERSDCANITEHYELLRCARWIEENAFSKVSLQFPDELLHHADSVALKLQECVGDTRIYVLADTSYSSCCVDEVAAEHVSSDAIIHFGPACLTPCNRLPVLYIFGKESVDVAHVAQEFLKAVPDTSVNALLLFDVTFSHISTDLYDSLSTFYPNLRQSELVIPSCHTAADITAEDTHVLISGRRMRLKLGLKLEDHTLFYVGREGPTLTKLMMTLNRCPLFSYEPRLRRVREESAAVNRSLRKRYYAVERARDAHVVGILMGTLGVSGYLQVVQRLKEVAAVAGKKTYTIVVGKLNPAKLANFPEIDVFVLVACPDNSAMDFKEFYRPIVTPFEFELACLEERIWTGEYVTDFRELMPGAQHHVPLAEATGTRAQTRTNVSLITGRLSTISANDLHHEAENTDRTVATKDDALTVAEIHSQAAGEFLVNRSWRGLDPGAAPKTTAVIRQGTSGTPTSYNHETQLMNNKE